MAKQMTLKAPFTLEGKGLHTGLNVVLTAKPAAENTGIIVRRVDLEVDNEIPALAENVAATERGTVLVKGEANSVPRSSIIKRSQSQRVVVIACSSSNS